jgi:glycerol kinase
VGLTRGTSKAQLIRATVESMAYQTNDVVSSMAADAGTALKGLGVDGGACANNFLMQFQADILGIDVIRPKVIETTALGAAYLAGLAVGFYKDTNDVLQNVAVDKTFKPTMDAGKRAALVAGWKEAVKRSLGWEKH